MELPVHQEVNTKEMDSANQTITNNSSEEEVLVEVLALLELSTKGMGSAEATN